MAVEKYTVEIVDSEGNSSKLVLPGFALDSTQEKLIKSVQALGKLNPKQAEAYEKLLDATNEATKKGKATTDKQTEELEKVLTVTSEKQVKALKTFRENFADRVGKDMRDTFVSGGNILTAAIKTATVGLAAGAGLLYKTFMDTSEAFRSLAQQGLGGGGATGTEARDAVANLTRLGMSAGEAAGLLTSFGQASAILGKANFSKFVSGIAGASSFAADLGLTLEEAAEFAAEEIEIRQRGLSSDLQLNSFNRQAIEESIQQTQRFAGVMGRSMKDMNAARKSFFEDNANIDALMMRFTGQKGEQLNSELNLMVNAAAAIPGAYETLTKGLINAAASDIPILDGFLKDVSRFSGLGVGLYEDVMAINKQMLNGSIDGEEGMKRFNRSLLRIDTATVTQLQRMAANGDQTAAMIISARRGAMLGAEAQEEAFKKAAAANDAMVTAAANFQNVLGRVTGEFTTMRNAVLGQFAEPLNKLMKNISLSGTALDEYNERRREEIDAMVDSGKISAARGEELKAALRTKSVFDTLNLALQKISTSFMKKFFPNIDTAGDSVGAFVDQIVQSIEYYSTMFSEYLDDLGGDTFGEKLGNMFKDLFSNVVIPALITALKEAFWALFTHPEVILGLVAALSGLSLAKSLFTAGLKTAGTWVATKLGLMAAPTATAGTAATAATTASLATKATSYAGMAGNTLKAVPSMGLAGKVATGASGLVSAAMVGKDIYDVGAALYKGEDVKGEDIGGVVGGIALGGIGLMLGGPVGAAIGATVGNTIGGWVGSWFDDEDDVGEEVAKQTKEELLQQNGLVAMAIDPEHVREVGRALAFFNAISVTEIATGIANLNPALAAFYETLQGIRVSFVDNVNNRFQRLVDIITGLNVEGLKLPTTTEHLGSLANKITAMPIEKIEQLAIAFSVLTKALRGFGDLTTSTTFGRMWDAFTGKRDETEDVIKILNNFADKVDSEKLLKAAQATMAFNAGMSGYAAVPAEPNRASPAEQGSPTEQVNTAANMQYNNPTMKFDIIIAELGRLNEKLSDSGIVIRTMNRNTTAITDKLD